jgi:hypothetical protein
MNRLALSPDGPVAWRPKYSLRSHTTSVWSGDDINELNSLLASYPSGPEEEAIDAVADWYNRGAGSTNPLTAFLCFYIGIESLTNAIFDRDATFDLGISTEDMESTSGSRSDQIEALRAELYDAHPEKFVRRAYFEVIIGSTERTRRLIEAVFGQASREFELLFSRADGPSLADLRSRLAHGKASELTQSEARTLRDRLSEDRMICRNLLLRLLLRTSSGEALPPSKRIASWSFQDPRAIEIATGLPEQDWTIQPDWVAWG